RGVAFQFTTEALVKLDPLTVRVKAPLPPTADAGAIEPRVGAGAEEAGQGFGGVCPGPQGVGRPGPELPPEQPERTIQRAALTKAARRARVAMSPRRHRSERPQELEHVLLLGRVQSEEVDDDLVRLARRVRRVTAARGARPRVVRPDRVLEVPRPAVMEE